MINLNQPRINPSTAYYIKLGRGGKQEAEYLTEPGALWVGWTYIDHQLCIDGKWERVRKIGMKNYNYNGPTATSQTNQLKTFYTAKEDVLWITFHNQRLYWCFAAPNIEVLLDGSRIRRTSTGWSSQNIYGDALDFAHLSGSLLAVQGYRATLCKVKEFDYLVRKINGETSPIEKAATDARKALITSLTDVIKDINPKEFELLIDMIFREAGWQRTGEVGKVQKGIDLDLFSPISRERYKVQVKSSASLNEYHKFAELSGSDQDIVGYYFIVHSPQSGLEKDDEIENVKLWFVDDIAGLCVDYGLVNWLIAKAK